MSRDPAFLEECLSLATALREHRALASLQASRDWPDLEARLGKILHTQRRYEPPEPPDEAPDPSRVMALSWNIEHGNRFEQVLAALRDHPQLQNADLMLLQEVDLGMARSGNRDVAQELAKALNLNAVWCPMLLETTRGRHDDLELADGRENLEGLFGIAILSRWPIAATRVIELPGPAAIHYDTEGMYGRHIALAATIERPSGPFTAVTTHLDVHRSKSMRVEQVRCLTAELAREARPILLGGDFNSTTFDRGRWWDPLVAGSIVAFRSHAALERRFTHPDSGSHRERLFDVFQDARFEWHPLNDRKPTLRLRLERLPEVRWLTRLLPAAWPQELERRLALRLDWLLGRDWRRGRGATIMGLDGPGKASDHAPIVAEFR